MTKLKKSKRSSKAFKVVIFIFIIAVAYLLAGQKLNVRVFDANASIEDSSMINYFNDSSKQYTLEELNNEEGKKVIYFTSSWCSSCSYNVSLLRDASANYSDLKFYVLDLDNNRDLASELNVEFVSEFAFIDNDSQKVIEKINSQDLNKTISLFNSSGIFAI